MTYDGKYKRNLNYAAVQIFGYEEMKKDFENYIQPHKKILFWSCKKHKYNVYWEKTNNVDAYIIS